MKNTHTPGPWLVTARHSKEFGVPYISIEHAAPERVCVIALDVAPVVLILADGQRIHNAEGQANAKLMAAAPELLAALEKICERSLLIVEDAEHGTQPTYDRAECAKLARAAIAKATAS